MSLAVASRLVKLRDCPCLPVVCLCWVVVCGCLGCVAACGCLWLLGVRCCQWLLVAVGVKCFPCLPWGGWLLIVPMNHEGARELRHARVYKYRHICIYIFRFLDTENLLTLEILYTNTIELWTQDRYIRSSPLEIRPSDLITASPRAPWEDSSCCHTQKSDFVY